MPSESFGSLVEPDCWLKPDEPFFTRYLIMDAKIEVGFATDQLAGTNAGI